MDLTTLNKANDLNRKIRDLSEAMNCFEYQPYSDEERKDQKVSTNPQLIIEFDGDGREQIHLPMKLNEVLVNFLKAEIKREFDEAVNEFNAL